jgi:DNA-binding NarL/FixJ family response regulator
MNGMVDLPAEGMQVLVVDDHPLFRDGLRVLLASAEGLIWVGEATNGDEAVQRAADLQPDVVLMDLQMPGMSGIEATRRILAASPHVRVLVVTMFEDDQSVFAALRAGARGYVLKGARHAEMLRAIRAVGSGEAIFSPSVTERLLDFFITIRATALTMSQANAFPELSEREREILDLMARGHRNPEIAQQLVLSPKTVRNHVSNILDKLQASDRAEAILRARAAGLG